MLKRIVSSILLGLLFLSLYTLLFHIQPVKASGAVYIRWNGSIDPPSAPISTSDNVTYTLTGNIISDADGIVIQRDYVRLDGAGYTIQGKEVHQSKGIDLTCRIGVMIKNTTIKQFDNGVYLCSASNAVVSGNYITQNELDGVAIEESSRSIVSGNTIANGYGGICIYDSSYNTVSGNHIENTTHSITLCGSSSYNTVSGNTITNNRGNGICIYDSFSNTVSGNTITNNGEGIYIYDSFSNTVSGNTITNNGEGICIIGYGRKQGSSDNIICGNAIANNSRSVYFYYSSNNRFYHNNFIKNTYPLYQRGSVNAWDNGYTTGGNYWSYYADVDLYSGPNQDEAGSDGIWDHPYVIDANNTDRYPLVNPWTLPPPSKFMVGDWVRTTANLNVREGPGLGYTIIDTMPLGAIGQILAGPAEADGFVWWDVNYSGKVIGWSAENWLELQMSEAPTCVVKLQKDGVEISEVGVGEFFDIYVGDSTSDIGIKKVRFSSDNVQDGYPTGKWTDWFNWGTSSEDWNATTKIKRWAFATPGYKELWAEVKDETDQTAIGLSTIFVPAPALPRLTSPLTITPVKDIYNVGDILEAEFTIKNIGDTPITLDVSTVGGRLNGFIPPEGAPDFTFRAVTLQPNEPYQYEGSLTITQMGNYRFFVAYYIENPTLDEERLLDENNWNTCVELGEGLAHKDRVKSIIVYKEGVIPDDVSQLKRKIESLIKLPTYVPPYLLGVDSWQESVSTLWADFTSWATQTDLTGKYDELYYAGIDYYGLRLTSLKNANLALNQGNIEFAKKSVERSSTYYKLACTSFKAASEVFDGNLEAGEVLAQGIKEGCEAAVKHGIAIVWPPAAVYVDAFYMGFDFAFTANIEGWEQAKKDLLKDFVFEVIFKEVKFADLQYDTLEDFVNRYSSDMLSPFALDAMLDNSQFMASLEAEVKKVISDRVGQELSEAIIENIADEIIRQFRSMKNSMQVKKNSPIDHRVIDSEGRITGMEDGKVKHGIPMSLYVNETVIVLSPFDTYILEVMGTDTGTYGLHTTRAEPLNLTTFHASGMPINNQTIHQYSIDWDALSMGEEGVTVLVDPDGNGVVDRILSSDKELTSEEFIEKMSATYPTYSLIIITSESGTTFPLLGTYACSANSTVQITAFPNEGYVLDYWKLDGVNASSNNPYRVLMQENHILNAVFRPATYDIAIADVSSSKTVVGQGYTLNINVPIANQGDFAENFNVTIYADTTIIEKREIILEGGASTTIVFSWNTTGFAKGNYTIWAYAEPLLNEPYVSDNTFIYGTIKVTIPGDVDGDFDVDIYDIVKICGLYHYQVQIYPPSPPDIANCDIDGDGDIDIFDVVAVCVHYGQKWP